MSAVIEMSDRDIRRILQKRGYWYANSTPDGPAHICPPRTVAIVTGLCGADCDTSLYTRATNLCKRCRQGAVKRILQAAQVAEAEATG